MRTRPSTKAYRDNYDAIFKPSPKYFIIPAKHFKPGPIDKAAVIPGGNIQTYEINGRKLYATDPGQRAKSAVWPSETVTAIYENGKKITARQFIARARRRQHETKKNV